MRTRAVSGTTLECILASVFVGGVTVENENAADWHSRPTTRLPQARLLAVWFFWFLILIFSYLNARCNFGCIQEGASSTLS